ncbi:MAG TPA: NB-ARC domain-containing protein, partial [Anaerolineae bacterium]|nr:NB-ARC domain-containing protein [Anaerolineae bacterium]
MPNDVSSQPSLPDELQARLAAAGVSDDASLAAALQADPSLAADLQAFIEANAAAMAGIAMAALLAAFAAVEDSQQMMDFWRSVPAGLEEPLMEAVAALIADAEQAGDADTVAHLRPRLDGFRQIHEAARQADEQPPVVQAVIAFVQAEDDGAAEALFAQTRTLLQPYEAQRLLDEQATSDDPAMLQRITERRALLRRLRGAAPTPPPPTPSPPQTQVTGDLYQAGRDQYHFSAHAESGGTASVVNNLFIHNLERRWLKPAPPVLERDAVPRTAEMQAVLDALAQRESVAITGQVAKAQALAVQGAPGVGKTTLAHLLARQLAAEERYADGVIWQELGPDFTRPEQAQAVLRQWAGYATGFFGLPDNLNKLFVFEPEGVRSLLAEHPRLLVVLDNVWSLAAIAPLRAALPAGAHLLITTRQRDLAQKLGGGLVAVGLLSRAEALALCELRLGWRPAVAAADDGWVSEAAGDGWAVELAQGVGLHALGLDVALGVLHRYGDGPADWAPAARRLIAAVRGGQVERLHLGDDDPGHNVQAVIRFSYDALPDDEARRRLRTLAAFAPEADFSTALAAAAWGCAEESAFETLTDLANAALLDRLGGGVWRQHGLLRAFGLALLRAAGEQEQAAAAHARAYRDAMRAADKEQRYHQMLPAMAQLRHAFDWALANDLELALDIATGCANVQKQFGLTREAGEWSERLLATAQAGRAGPATLARAFGHRANRLSELATLPGEDRRQRLVEALAAYDEALRHYRPDTAPLDYAATQNNRATLLSELATLPGEARRQRLYEALAAYDEALRHYRPDTAPLDYAATQNNRATLLSELATLPGEARRQRLYEALAAYDEALRHYRPDTAPLDYAATQNNRGLLLRELATLPGEERRQRLVEALAAYDEALRFRRPDTAPLAYAATQNNRATILRELATLPGEARRQRLDEALAAYDEALRFRRPDTAPLAYAMTQNNRANILSALATLPGEARRQRLVEALAAYDEALRFRRPDTAPLAYAMTQNNRANRLSELATLPGE